MDKQNWSKEPWDVDSDGELSDAEGINLIAINAYKDMRDIADTKRLVACVNALRGIPTEELEKIITWTIDGLYNNLKWGGKQERPDWLIQAQEMRK